MSTQEPKPSFPLSLFTYNPQGKVSSQTLPEGGERTMVYEPVEHHTAMNQREDGSAVSYTYTPTTNLLNLVIVSSAIQKCTTT